MMNQKKSCLLIFCAICLVQSQSTTEEITNDQIIMPSDEILDKFQNNECTVLSGTQEIVGICVPIKRCEVLFKLLEQVERRPDIKTFLLSLRCHRNKGSQVCCPYSSVKAARLKASDHFSNFLSPPYCGKTSVTESRIIGGEFAEKGAWPWLAALGYRTFENTYTSWMCGGTIITQQHVLTAAHCTKPKHTEYILHKVKLGAYDLTNNLDGMEITIEKVITHPNYTFSTSSNDIGIIKLTRPINFNSNIQPICLPKTMRMQSETFVGHYPFVSGWGATNFATGKKSLANQMQAQIPVVDNYFCNNTYLRHGRQIHNEQICAYDDKSQKDTCQGDSGGPLMLSIENTYYIIGIVSFGYRCGEPGYPGVYTRVTSYLNWISTVIS